MTQLEEVEAAERRMTKHLLSGEYGLTECGLRAETVHATAFIRDIDCPACARSWLELACFDDDPKKCPAESHARAAALAFPKMEVVR